MPRKGGDFKLELKRRSRRYCRPLLKQLAALLLDAHDFVQAQRTYAHHGRGLVELVDSPDGTACSLGGKEPDDHLGFSRFRRQRPASTFAGGVFDIPALGDQSKKPAAKPERGLHGEMCQVMQREVCSVAVGLLLPGDRTICADAAQDSGSIRSLGDLDTHILSFSDSPQFHAAVGGTHVNQGSTGSDVKVQVLRADAALHR